MTPAFSTKCTFLFTLILDNLRNQNTSLLFKFGLFWFRRYSYIIILFSVYAFYSVFCQGTNLTDLTVQFYLRKYWHLLSKWIISKLFISFYFTYALLWWIIYYLMLYFKAYSFGVTFEISGLHYNLILSLYKLYLTLHKYIKHPFLFNS